MVSEEPEQEKMSRHESITSNSL